jgi:hypothetical protein
MRRKYKLTNKDYKDINLKNYEQIIIDTINKTVPNKNPKVFKDYFSTDVLNQSESVAIGRALSKIEELSVLGKSVTTFRLFDGKNYLSEQSKTPINKKDIDKQRRKKND